MNKRTFNIHIKNSLIKKILLNYIYKYRHFNNLYIIFVDENKEDLFTLLDYNVMRAVLRNTKGGKNSDKVKYIQDKYKNNQKFNELKKLSNELKIHNISAHIKDLKTKYITFFRNIKKSIKTNKPRPKKLKNIVNYSILLDKISVSFKKKDKIGINLYDKMFYIKFNDVYLKKIVDSKKNIKNLRIKYSNGEIYLSIIYEKTNKEFINKNNKMSAIDIGIENIISLFIDDKKYNSLIFDGKIFKKYNSKFNRFMCKLNKSIEYNSTKYKTSKIGTKYSTEWNGRGNYLKKYKNYLYEKRNRFFYNEFHKLSKRIVEYLILNEVDVLILSKNLSKLKNTKNKKSNKISRQKFIQIPIIKLLNYIELKCNENGIKVEFIDEAYTSKTSCLTDDVNNPLDNELNAVRSKRGLIKDKKLNKIWNCDVNGAVNHIKKYDENKNFDWLLNNLYKLCNPVKIKCDYDFIKFMNNRVDKVNQNIGLQRCLLNV